MSEDAKNATAPEKSEAARRKEFKLLAPQGYDEKTHRPVLIQGGEPKYPGNTVKLKDRQAKELRQRGLIAP